MAYVFEAMFVIFESALGILGSNIKSFRRKGGLNSLIKGKGSISLDKEVYIYSSAAVTGKKEGEGPLGRLFDHSGTDEDDLFGCQTWEEAESKLQREALNRTLEKAGVKAEELSCLIAGDLLSQTMASTFGNASVGAPFLGTYGACSTCGEALSLGAMMIAGGFAGKVACVTSSHFGSAEKEFRYPLEYGNQRPLSATWTVTGSGAFLLASREEMVRRECKPLARISSITIGRIVDYGMKDSMNMGACMAPAAADTIERFLIDYQSQTSDFDKIITGDLGMIGQQVLFDKLREKGVELREHHMDCGIEIYDSEKQDTHSGGSGCACCAVTLASYILKQLKEQVWKKVLFVPTGALLSKTSFNEGCSIPAIAHALLLESVV